MGRGEPFCVSEAEALIRTNPANRGMGVSFGLFLSIERTVVYICEFT